MSGIRTPVRDPAGHRTKRLRKLRSSVPARLSTKLDTTRSRYGPLGSASRIFLSSIFDARRARGPDETCGSPLDIRDIPLDIRAHMAVNVVAGRAVQVA
jgi:hypothetical protein